MAGINKAILVGNVGQSPTTRTMSNGEMVANFSVATSETWKDKQTGERREATEWHRIVAYRQLAEIIDRYLTRGSKVYIEGKIKTRKWTDRDGVEKYTTEIIADQMQMLSPRDNQAPPPAQSSQPAPPPATNADGFNDDIPF